ncbi:MAG: acetylxylan esterase, partial [Verrucomicrobiae bacterium]|nr:acetylxylan esterase [Verrucomicrobiae bacterium]
MATPLLAATIHAKEPKEYDYDLNYQESRLPAYTLPPLLVAPDGKRITTAEEWQIIRRPQILALFSNLVYG